MRRSVLLGSVALAASYMLPIIVLLGCTQGQQNLGDQQNVNQKYSYGSPTGLTSSHWSFYTMLIPSTDPSSSPAPAPAPAPSPAPGTPAYPIAVSANKHYFVDANNQPYYMVADSVWALATSLTPTQAVSYFQLRASQGFNAALIDAVNDGIIFGAPTNPNGNAPFTAKLPGSNAADLSKPNEAYWQDFDKIIRMAAQNHILVIVNIYETYSATFSSGDGGSPNGDSPNSLANFTAYGNFLGKRYVNYDNIMWMFGNDYQDNDRANNNMMALFQGIRQYDTRHLFTLENGGDTITFWNTTMRPYLDANGIYMYYGHMGSESYRSHFLDQYSRADVAPTFNMESDYDASPNGFAWELRMQHYVYLLSGSSGDWYGHDHVWGFQSDWQNVLTTQGTIEIGYFNTLRNSIPWTSLIPDQNGTVFTGIGGNTSSEYSGASTADGKLALAYKPKSGAGAQRFTVNMAAFSGAVTAKWYDPTNGTYIAIGSGLVNSGSKSFNTPTKNSAGDNDFVLVLTVL